MADALTPVPGDAVTPFVRLEARTDVVGEPERWANDRLTVQVERDEHGVTWLMIRRLDGEPIRDWRDMQQAKNEIAGPTVEAVEVFPAMDRIVDTANSHHLWCGYPGQRLPFGLVGGVHLGDGEDLVAGLGQRPIPDVWR